MAKKIKGRNIRNQTITAGKLSPDIALGSGGRITTLTAFIDVSGFPNKPVGGSYDFDTGVATAPSGWVLTRPVRLSQTLYVSYGVAFNDMPIVWTDPIRETDTSGFDLSRLRFRTIFTESNSVPDVPTMATFNTDGTDLVESSLDGWSFTRPTSSDEDVYEALGVLDTTTRSVQWGNPSTVADTFNFVPSIPTLEPLTNYGSGNMFWRNGKAYRVKSAGYMSPTDLAPLIRKMQH